VWLLLLGELKNILLENGKWREELQRTALAVNQLKYHAPHRATNAIVTMNLP
jgi:hypothetical protein